MDKIDQITSLLIGEDNSEVVLTNVDIDDLIVSSKIQSLKIEESAVSRIQFNDVCLIEQLVIIDSQIKDILDLRRMKNITSLVVYNSNIESIIVNSKTIKRLVVKNSHVSGNVSLTGCTITNEVEIGNTHVNGDIKIDSASIMCNSGLVFRNNIIDGDVDLSDTVVNGIVDISNTQINNLASNDLESRNGGFSLSGCTLKGNLLLRHAVIDGIADFSGITVSGDADMRYSMFNGLFDAANSIWHSNIDLSFYSREIGGDRLQFRGGMHFDHSKITGDLICNDIVNSGEMLFIDSEVSGKLELTNSSISGVAILQKSTFAGLVNFSGSRFLSRFTLDFMEADSFQLDRSYHNDRVTLTNCTIHKYFHSPESQFIRGLRIQSTQFNGEFTLYRSSILEELIIQKSIFKLEFDIRELNSPLEIDLIEIFDSQFSLNANISNTSITAKKILVKDCFFERKFLWRNSHLRVLEISFINIEFNSLVDFRGTDFIFPNCISFIRVSSENVLLKKEQLQDALYMAKSKGNFPEKAWRHERNAESFHWAKDVFAWNRRYSDQDWALYHYLRENALKKIYMGFAKPLGFNKLLKAIFVDFLGIYLFWRLVCGFGLRLRYMLWSSVLIVGLFGLLFSMNPNEMVISDEAYNTMVCENRVVVSEEEFSFPAQNYQSSYTATLRHSMKFSASIFTSMTSGATFMKIDSSFGLLVIIEGMLGVLFTTLFIGSAIRKVIRTV